MKSIIFLLIVSILMFAHTFIIEYKIFKTLNDINNLIKQKSNYFKNKKLSIIFILVEVMLAIFFLAFISATVLAFILKAGNSYWYPIIMCAILISVLTINFILPNIVKSVYVIEKNNKFVFWDKVVSKDQIIIANRDEKRRYISVKFISDDKEENIKIRYSWELKDFIKSYSIKTNF